jgi:sulfatase modifying factor 1
VSYGTVSKPFYLGQYEVTQGEWEKVMGKNPSAFSKSGKDKDKVAGMNTSRFPVESVSWFDCVAFCNKLSEMEGLKPYYAIKVLKEGNGTILDAEVQVLGGSGYKLPTDAEWTWACAAGAKTKFNFGSQDEDLPAYAWFKDNSDGRTHLVARNSRMRSGCMTSTGT